MVDQKTKHKISLMNLAIIALALIAILGLSIAAYMNPQLFRASGGMAGGYGGYGGRPNPDGGGGGLPGGIPGLPGGGLNPQDLLNQIRRNRPIELPTLTPRGYVPVTTTTTTTTNPVCGNGVVESGEACDDGNVVGNDYCSADCKTVTGRCGDSTVQTNENCDDGNTTTETCAYGQTSCTVCNSTCHYGAGTLDGRCGDGVFQSSNEVCDGTQLGGATCETVTYGTKPSGNLACNSNCLSFSTSGCTIRTVCGDGKKEGSEACDDGDLNGTYGKCNTACTGPGLRCGDNVVNGTEACDGSVPSGKTCGTQMGAGSTGTLSCTPSCTLSTASCSEVPRCGDSLINVTGEQCDPPSSGQSCAYGQESCQVCNSTCRLVAGTVVGRCGDGIIQSANGEVCDGSNLNSQTCSTVSAGAKPNGTVTCSADCKSLNSTACTPYSITNCPTTVLAGYTTHPSAHPNAKIYGAGGTTYTWKLDGNPVTGASNYVKLVGMSPGSHTLTLGDSVTCGPFNVTAYNSTDVTKANSLSVNTSWSSLELLLYDWNGDGVITATACPAPSATSNTVVKSDKLGIYGATQGNTSTTCP